MKNYKVLCNGTTKFPNLANLTVSHGSVRRFVGWEEKDGKLVPKKEPETIPATSEYTKALMLGELLPGDLATAEAVGVPFAKSQEKKPLK